MEQTTIQKKETFTWPPLTIGSYVLSVILICVGLYKMFAYNSGDGWEDPVNAYVGGDAYNYIINANYSTGFFILALICIVFGSTIAIIHALNIPTQYISRTTGNQSNFESNSKSIDVELPPL